MVEKERVMNMNVNRNNGFCCREMGYYLEEGRVPIKYFKQFRSYGIQMIEPEDCIDPIDYCPWCGSKLPEDLGETFFKVLESEYGIQTTIGDLQNHPIPEEFQSDEWWKKRRL